ncbi:CTD small phosphatase-like protein 2-A [Eleutherodactylus coqui]|uniref:CTD small phosphatase-like protein 2-A n=1 Tax=Eleutherodactylus coqui TaxID=57060 RepID=UPI0034621F2A
MQCIFRINVPVFDHLGFFGWSLGMILRSRKMPSRAPKESNSMKNPEESISAVTPQSMNRRPQSVKLKLPAVNNITAWDDAVTPCSRKHTVQHLQDFIEDEDQHRRTRVHFQIDESSPGESGISSPLVCLNSPDSSRSAGRSPPNPTEVQQKSIPDPLYFSPLPGEEAREDFNPFKFMCSAQAASDNLRPRRSGIPCKTRSTPESSLVLALEEVLVESTLLPQPDAQFTFFAPFQDTDYKIFVYTTAKREYAGQILEILDPQKKLIRHRLYQDHCVCVSGHYIKDLNVLHRDLAKTVALDKVAYTLPFHLANRIPVKRWSGNQTDEELLTLIPVLEQLTHVVSGQL